MDWIISLVSIASMELTIRKLWFGWVLALMNQILWAHLIYNKAAWGLVPLNIAMTIQSSRGLVRWLREARKE